MESEVLNLTKYAKHAGVSQQRISKLKAEGRLEGCYTQKGRLCLFDVAATDARLAESLDPAQTIKAKVPISTSPRALDLGVRDPKKADFNQSRAVNEYFKAELRKADYEERIGNLLRKEDVEKEAFDCARTIRDFIMNIPNRISDQLAVTGDREKIEQILKTELTNALESLSDEL